SHFAGTHSRLGNAPNNPKPLQPRVPIWIGGRGEKRTLRAAAKFADGWNAPYIGPEEWIHKGRVLDRWCETEQRNPRSILRTVNLGFYLGADAKGAARGEQVFQSHFGKDPRDGFLRGTPKETLAMLTRFRDAGCARVNMACLERPRSAGPPRRQPRRIAAGCRRPARASRRTIRRPTAAAAPTSTAPTPSSASAASLPLFTGRAPLRLRRPRPAVYRRGLFRDAREGQLMTKEDSALIRGLEGVVAAETRLCDLDGKNGRLAYVGYDIDELARKATFEEVTYLLLHGELPRAAQLDGLTVALTAAREIPRELIAAFGLMPKATDPMRVLQAAVAILGMSDPDATDHSHAANVRKAIRLTSQIATAICAHHRVRSGQEPVAPAAGLGHAAN